MIWLFISLCLVATLQAYLSSEVNKGLPLTWAGVSLVGLGILVSLLWIGFAKYSSNLFRDGLLWDIVVTAIFCLVMVLNGHTAGFYLKHWVGVGLTLGIFAYWIVIK